MIVCQTQATNKFQFLIIMSDTKNQWHFTAYNYVKSRAANDIPVLKILIMSDHEVSFLILLQKNKQLVAFSVIALLWGFCSVSPNGCVSICQLTERKHFPGGYILGSNNYMYIGTGSQRHYKALLSHFYLLRVIIMCCSYAYSCKRKLVYRKQMAFRITKTTLRLTTC